MTRQEFCKLLEEAETTAQFRAIVRLIKLEYPEDKITCMLDNKITDRYFELLDIERGKQC